MPRKLEIVIIFLITIHFLVFFPFLPSIGSASKSNISLNSIRDFHNITILNPGIPQTNSFNNESTSHNWILETVIPGQIVYFSIDPYPLFTRSDLLVTLFNPKGKFTPHQEYPATKYLGSWIASETGNWSLQLNNTRAVDDENFYYEILASLPSEGYNDDSAILLNSSANIGNFTIEHEVQYWKLSLNVNQNCTVLLKETTTSVLYDAGVTIYTSRLGKGNPVPVEKKSSESEGWYNFSWNAYVNDDYIIEIKHSNQGFSPTGLYNISFEVEEELYSFATAKNLPHNQTISVHETHFYAFQKKYYFWFQVEQIRSEVNIWIYEVNPTHNTILDFAEFEIYDPGLQNPIHTVLEINQPQDGEINITLTLDEGKYYFVISPKTETTGQFNIHFEYRLPQPFIWTLQAIMLTFVSLIAIPVCLIYLDTKGKWYRINQWTFPASLQETFKFLKYSFGGIFNIKEVPKESILVRVTNVPLKTFGLVNFVESSEMETLVISKRLHRKSEWIIYFFFGLIIFDLLNLVSSLFLSINFLPFYISSPVILLLILAFPTTILAIIVLFVNVSAFINYNRVVNRITYGLQNYQESSNNGVSPKRLDSDQAWKNINYVRVLWNQAKNAFKENNYELFVIKADAAVKNLLSTRYLQLISEDSYSKPDFQFQVTSLRKRGFDLPNDKKIAQFRNLRNRIVHSSVTLDEKESVDCFAFYSTFITRLGLRST
ncbi:MAG: hypothetical protein JSV04_07655 [Candidatus Heimdallarchaeota archaeon]|nr:MAG: hypothetical protein JSV04_07655 [Candidatus Heimdallarchaeota archaeon]